MDCVRNIVLSLALTSLLAGCGNGEHVDSASRSTVAGDPRVSVLSGIATTNHPAIIKVRNVEDYSFCTGTFVNENTLLTASHCINVNEVGGAIAIDSDATIRGIAKFYNTGSHSAGCTGGSYPLSLIEVCPPLDLAVIVFPPGTAGSLGIRSFPRVATQRARALDSVHMFGYGPTVVGGSSDGKNAAWATVASAFLNHFTFFVSDHRNALAGLSAGVLNGDSGGPVFNRAGEIVGINSGFQWWSNGNFRSYHTDIKGSNSQAVFDYAFSFHDRAKRPLPIPGVN